MRTCWNPTSTRPYIETLYTQLHKLRLEKDAADEAEFERKWAKMSSREARVVKVEVHASDFVGFKHNIIDNDESSNFSSNSLPVQNSVGVTGHANNSSVLSEPVSGLVGQNDSVTGDPPSNDFTTPIRLVGKHLTSTPLMPERQVTKHEKNQDKNFKLDSILGQHHTEMSNTPQRKSGPQVTSTPILPAKVENTHSNDVIIPVVSEQVAPADIQDKNCENQDKISNLLIGASFNSVSDKVFKENDFLSKEKDSHQPKVKVETEKNFVLNGDVTMEFLNGKLDIKEKELNLEDKSVDIDAQNGLSENGERGSIAKFEGFDSVIDFEKNYGVNHSNNISQNILPLNDQVFTDSQNRPDMCSVADCDNGNDDEEENRLEQLKQLKLTLTGVLPTDPQISKEDSQSGKSSPASDDMEFAREIYLSKGMSCPPSKYTSTRSLNTILEDELLCEEEPDIPKPKPESKFVEPLEESNTSSVFHDTFEWDDYIGDELVGQVETSAVSSRKSMDFSDWTMDSSHNSDVRYDSQNDSGAIYDKKRTLNTVHISPELTKAKTSPSASTGSTKSPKTPLGSAAQSYVKHILSNQMASGGSKSFYSFSHGIDLDDDAPITPSYNSVYNPVDDWDL